MIIIIIDSILNDIIKSIYKRQFKIVNTNNGIHEYLIPAGITHPYPYKM